MIRQLTRNVLGPLVGYFTLAAAVASCSGTVLPLEDADGGGGKSPVGNTGSAGEDDTGSAGADTAGSGRGGTGGARAVGGSGTKGGSAGKASTGGTNGHGGASGTDAVGGNGGTAGKADDAPDFIPPAVAPPAQQMFEIRTDIGGELSDVRFIGDLDGDGYDELALSDYTSTSDLEGTLWVFYGRATFPELMNITDADFAVHGITTQLEKLGDLDGDGYDDLLFGTDCASAMTGMCAANGVYVVYGAAERLVGNYGADDVGARFVTDRDNAQYANVRHAGDVNGDGRPDLLIDMFEPASQDANRYTLLELGRADRSAQFPEPGYADAVFSWSDDAYRAYMLVPVGDVDGDGFGDLMLGVTPQHTTGTSTESFGNLFYGGPNRFADTLAPADADASLGVGDDMMPWGDIGDLDGDGYADLGFYASVEGIDGFRVVYGQGERFHGNYGGEIATFSASCPSLESGGTGDMNGDGLLDLTLGGSGAGDRGSVALLVGTSNHWHGTTATYPDYSVFEAREDTLEVAYYGFGIPSAVNGDTNGDGYDDLVVAAVRKNLVDTTDVTGSAFVFFGGPF